MSLLSSLNSGVSGLQQFQEQMDVIGNNVANVNTVGYKASRVAFADAFSQSLQSGSGAVEQVGNGVATAAIENLFTQGTITRTGIATDAAISGPGFFVVRDPTAGAQYATRDGQFHVDANGYLITETGLRVQGFSDGNLSTRGDIQLDASAQVAANVGTATSALNDAQAAKGSADAAAAGPNARIATAQTLADSLATAASALAAAAAKPSDTTLANAATTAAAAATTAVANATTAAQTAAAADPGNTSLADFSAQMNALKTAANSLQTATATAATSHAAADFTTAQSASDTATALAATALNNAKSAAAPWQAAASAAANQLAQAHTALEAAKTATITSVGLGADGRIKVQLGDGTSFVGGQILLQNFRDPNALTKEGNNLLSGWAGAAPLAQLAAPDTNGLGRLEAGSLELSNVDLAGEFSSLITTQRAFQASARIVTTSDELLQDLINLKR